MSHYNSKYKKDYKANLSYQAKQAIPVNTSVLNQRRQVGLANQQEALQRCYNPRAQPQAGDGNVYTRENGEITGCEPIHGLFQANFSSWEDQKSDDESVDESDDNLIFNFPPNQAISTLEETRIEQNQNLELCNKKHEEEIEKIKKEHSEQIKQYQNKLDKQKKEFCAEITKLRQSNQETSTISQPTIPISEKITKQKELYDNELKKQNLIQIEIRELEQILQIEPIQFNNVISIDINDNSDLHYDILKIQTGIIIEENDRLILIKESYLN